MKSPTHQPNEHQAIQKPERKEAAQEADFAKENSTSVNPQLMRQLPSQGAGQLRRAAILQMQRRLGNSFVQRQLGRSRVVVQRSPAAATIQRQDESEQASSPTAIGDGSASVKAEGGIVRAEGGMMDLNSPMIRAPGVLQVDTIIANSVVGSSYTPGAGNIW